MLGRFKVLNLLSYLLLIIFIICYAIVFSKTVNSYANSETASELILSKQMSIENKIILKDWFYSTEVRLLDPNLIFSLLF